MESHQENKEEHPAMHLSYSLVAKRPGLLHRLTGLTVAEFERLCEQFASQYHLLVI